MTIADKVIYSRMFELGMFELGFGLADVGRIKHALKDKGFVWIINDNKDEYMFAGPDVSIERLQKEGIWPK